MGKSIVFFSHTFLFVGLVILNSRAFAANDLAQTFTLDGQLTLSGTSDPLLDANAKVVVQILDPAKNCLLYEEQQTVNTAASNGYFNIQIGSITGAIKRTADDPGLSMAQIYQNTVAVAAANAPGKTCVGASYTPTVTDSRYFRIIVTPSATNIADTLSPDTVLDSVPTSLVAQTLQGYSANQFLILGSGDLTQANLQTVFATGNAAKLNSLLAVPPTNYVTKDATSGLIQLPTGAGTPTGVAAGQIWYDGGVLKYYDGSLVQSLGVAGAGLQFLNGASGSTQTFATGTAGTDFNISTATNTHTFNFPNSSASNRGLLTSADWTSFNAKLGTPLAAGKVWVGNASGEAAAVSFSGDATIDTAGAVTANKTTTAEANKLLSLNGSGVATSMGSQLNGLTSGSVTLQPAAVTTNYSLTFPAAQGGVGQTFSNNGSGVLSWVTPLTSGTGFVNGGNTFAGSSSIGNNDNYSLDIKTNNISRMTILNSGNVGIGTASPNSGLEVAGALRLSTTGTDSFITPAGTSLPTKINIPFFNPGSYGQMLISGLPSTAESTARVISAIDARTGAHQPSLAVLTPDESNIMGFSFEGSNSNGYVKSTVGLGFLVNGTTEAIHLATSGNVGLGTTTPQSKLSVYGSGASGPHLSVGTVGTGGGQEASLVLMSKSNGNDMVGTATSKGWQVFAASNAYTTATMQNDLVFSYWNGGTWQDTLTLDSLTGTIGIGAGQPEARLDVKDTGTTTSAIIVPRAGAFTGTTVNGMIRYNTASALFEFYQNGAWVNFTTVSDGRLKTNVVPVNEALEIVNQLNPVFFDWDQKNARTRSFGTQHQVGFIAQEVEKVLPEVVNTGEDSYRSVEYGKIVAVAVAAVKELYKRFLEIEDRQNGQDSENSLLRARVESVERENAALKARLDKIERMIQTE